MSNIANQDLAARRAAARASGTSAEDLIALSADENENVRYLVAVNPHTPEDALDHLIADEDSQVRSAATSNPNASSAMLEKAFTDSAESAEQSEAVRHYRSPDRDKFIHEKIPADEESLARRLRQTDILIRADIRFRVVKHDNATTAILEAGIKDPWSGVRCAVLERPDISPKILTIAIDDAESEARELAASHPNATPEILAKAMDDTDEAVRRAAARNRIAPPEVLAAALLDEDKGVAVYAAKNWKERFTQEATLPPPATPARTGGIRQ